MNKRVSIILIHYNQKNFVKEALTSVFEQNYKNIELIFADDASFDIDLDDLKAFSKKNNKNHFDIIWQVNKSNLGTVKNVNRAVRRATGDYILIFAADDKLCSSEVITKFVNSFENQSENVAMVFGQCFMMDKNLEKLEGNFIDVNRAFKFNEKSPLEQFEVLSTECFIAMGAAMIKSSILKKVGLFDERYKYAEDWPIFLNLTSSNYKLMFNDVEALVHRDGGISHRDVNLEPEQHHIDFEIDLLNILNNEVLPRFNTFNYKKKCQVVDLYQNRINNLIKYGAKFVWQSLKKCTLFV